MLEALEVSGIEKIQWVGILKSGSTVAVIRVVATVEGKRTERFSEKSLNLENSFKSEVRFPSSKETLKLRR
jgi:hypothetical protein